MGHIEKDSKEKRRNTNIQKIILKTVSTVGLISIAVLAPNVVGALMKSGIIPKSRIKESIHNSRKRLIKADFLKYEGGFLRLTAKGEKKLREIERCEYKLKKPRRWDKRWRVLIFDISEKRKGLRDKVRNTLVSIGFAQLQKSVWVYPYDCEDLITLLKADFKVGKDILYLVVESMENDKNLRNSFGLL